jgi:hypothetical protein
MGKGNREHGTENQEQGTKRTIGWGLQGVMKRKEEEEMDYVGKRKEEMEMALDTRRWQLQHDMWILALW